MPVANFRKRWTRFRQWELILSIAKMHVADSFPTEYHESLYAMWESRIEDGHKKEGQYLRKLSKEYANGDDVLADDYSQTKELTNTMYAALVVAIWSEIEHNLSRIIRACNSAFGLRETSLREMKKFCRDTLSGKKPQSQFDSLATKVRDAIELPHEFPKISGLIQSRCGVECAQCKDFATVNAIRLLNNAFKHNSGRYEPAPQRNNGCIDASLLSKWKIEENTPIDYANLPRKELLAACNSFFNDLFPKVEIGLTKKLQKLATKAT